MIRVLFGVLALGAVVSLADAGDAEEEGYRGNSDAFIKYVVPLNVSAGTEMCFRAWGGAGGGGYAESVASTAVRAGLRQDASSSSRAT